MRYVIVDQHSKTISISSMTIQYGVNDYETYKYILKGLCTVKYFLTHGLKSYFMMFLAWISILIYFSMDNNINMIMTIPWDLYLALIKLAAIIHVP